MTQSEFTLDTSGSIPNPYDPTARYVWENLTPVERGLFLQMFEDICEPSTTCPFMYGEGGEAIEVGFSSLAPYTFVRLAGECADLCDEPEGTEEAGRKLWCSLGLLVHLGDDNLIHLDGEE